MTPTMSGGLFVLVDEQECHSPKLEEWCFEF